MSDCNHFWIMPDAPECVAIVCRACRKPLLAVEANAIINRAERAEERVKELEQAIFDVLCGEENEVVKKLILDQGCDEVACQYLNTCDHCPIVTTEMENT